MTTRSILAAAVALTSLTLVATAQYTPGSGGTYLPPSTPQVPPPYRPAQQQPTYSWETQQQPQLVPIQPDAIQVIQPQAPQVYIPRLSDSQLADLTASIALYPDPLVATMLPASTYVEELTYADRWLAQHPGADEYTLSTLPLEPSVISLMHYPSVITLMVEHLDWAQALGLAFQYQGNDVMESIQRWRITAVTYGTLASSPQQQVLQQGSTIYIVPPPRTQVVYVPVYDPAIVYVRPYRPAGNYITFSSGGFSLSFIENDVDWHDHQVRVPVHHDYDHHDGPPSPPSSGRGPGGPPGGGGGSSGGRGGSGAGGSRDTATPPPARGADRGAPADRTIEKTVFVRDSVKPTVTYPKKVVTPQPDKKVVTIAPATTSPATAPATAPGDRGRGRGRGAPPNNAATPF